MQRLTEGEWESVWKEAFEMENRRIKRKRHAGDSGYPQEEKMKIWNRIKRLVNDGELSKARDIDSAGAAEPTEAVRSELRRK